MFRVLHFACVTFLLCVPVFAQDDPTSVVSGKLLMPDGKTPAEGADVHLLRRSGGSYTLPVKTQKTTTDKQGRYQFAAVAPGNYKVWAETPQLTTLQKKLGGMDVTVGEQGQAVDLDPLSLHEGCNYQVKVVSAQTNEPLPSARVWFGWTDIDRQYHADKDGVVRIGGLAVDDWYFVVAADGHGIQYKKIPKQPLGSTTQLEFKLGAGADLDGVVQTEEGQPVADARVSARSTEGGMTPGYGRSTSDKQGRFRLLNVPAGVAIEVSAGKKDHSRAKKEMVIVAGSGSNNVVLICNPRPYGGDCIVTVVDEDDQPIAGATLRNVGSSSSDYREVTTDDNGQGRLVHMYPSYRGNSVSVRAQGFITQELGVETGTAEEPSHVKVVMARGKSLRGQVLDPQGNPAPRLRVYYNEGEHGHAQGGRVETDADGKFQIDGLPEQSTLTVYTPRQFAPINDLPVTVGGDQPITITMQLAAIVRVRAIDAETGKPIPEFNVRVQNSRDRQEGDPWGSFSTAFTAQGVNILGEKKEFRMESLNEGTPLQVTVSAKGYVSVVQPRVLAVRSDQAQLIDVRLQQDSPENYQQIRGTLLSRDGAPVVGAVVKLIVGKVEPVSEAARARGGGPDNWRFYHWDTIERGQVQRDDQCLQFLSASTDEQGMFQFDRVQKNGPWIELFHTGGKMAPGRYPDLRHTHGNSLDDLRLSAVAPASVKLWVDREKWPTAHSIMLSSPFSSQYPDCLHQPFGTRSAQIGATNEVKFADLPAGEYMVTVQGKPVPIGNGGFRVSSIGSYTVTVPAGEELEGEL